LQLGAVERGTCDGAPKRGAPEQGHAQPMGARAGGAGANGLSGGSVRHQQHHVVGLRLGRPGSSGSSSGGESERGGSAGPGGVGPSSLLLARLPSYDAVKRLAQLHSASQEMPLFR